MKPTPVRTNNPATYLQDRFFVDLLNEEKQKLPKTTFQKISRKVAGVAVGTLGVVIGLGAMGLGVYTLNPILVFAGGEIAIGAVAAADRIYAPEKYCGEHAFQKLTKELKIDKVDDETLWEKAQRTFGFGRTAQIVSNRYNDLDATLREYNRPPLQDYNFQPKSDLFQLVEKNMSLSNYNQPPKSQQNPLHNGAENSNFPLPGEFNKENLPQEQERTNPAKTTTPNNSSPSASPSKPTLLGRLVDMARSTFGMSR